MPVPLSVIFIILPRNVPQLCGVLYVVVTALLAHEAFLTQAVHTAYGVAVAGGYELTALGERAVKEISVGIL